MKTRGRSTGDSADEVDVGEVSPLNGDSSAALASCGVTALLFSVPRAGAGVVALELGEGMLAVDSVSDEVSELRTSSSGQFTCRGELGEAHCSAAGEAATDEDDAVEPAGDDIAADDALVTDDADVGGRAAAKGDGSSTYEICLTIRSGLEFAPLPELAEPAPATTAATDSELNAGTDCCGVGDTAPPGDAADRTLATGGDRPGESPASSAPAMRTNDCSLTSFGGVACTGCLFAECECWFFLCLPLCLPELPRPNLENGLLCEDGVVGIDGERWWCPFLAGAGGLAAARGVDDALGDFAACPARTKCTTDDTVSGCA